MKAHEVSSSSSSKSKLWTYDVYLSFCGVDTRDGFTRHLHAVLKDRGYHVYMDENDLSGGEEIKEEMFHTALEQKGYKAFIDEDDLKRGEEIKPELLRAIEESRISIIVFSKRYADSSWCLDELVKIMDCRSKLEQHVLPIFYDVEASDIRKQKGSLAPMFQKHEENIRKEEDDKKGEAKRERVEQWREALTEAANLSGHDLKNTANGHEAKLINEIVENILKWLPRTNEVSSSSASKSKLWNYDVYLSFSGVDTRYGFTGHLHAALKDRGYHAYMDEDDLSGGEEIKEEMFRAIEESRISIIVFSKSYADSSWCLDELVKIMECRSKLGRHVLPVFYYVNISHVRKQNGDLAKAFQKHEEGIREEKDDKEREAKQERVKQWREALTEAANLFSHHLQITDPGSEAMLVREMVDKIITEWLEDKLHVAKHPIGIKSRVQGIISDLSSGGLNDVLMVGILGMGGLGKTTAAKAIYNQIHRMFEFKSFLADVSNTSSKHGLVYLQETLISDILKQKSQIRSVDIGISMIQEVVQHRRVLIIIDNITHREQLDAIARSHDWFGPGSRIIMTTRNEHLLKLVKVDKTYLFREMKKEEALELFSWHAFQKSCPNEEYLEVSKKAVSYCGGLPLALEVLGSFLFKRPIKEWKSQLEKLKRIPEGEIIKPLRISFEGLDHTEKATFLDISCFFIGEDKDYVAKILDGCGFYATEGISVLCKRCLVTVEGNRLKMHDLLQEMARGIIYEIYPYRSRLWNRRDVLHVLSYKFGTIIIEGLALHLQSSDEASFSTKAFAKMKKLRLLDLSGVELNGEYKHLPKKLIWLRWKLCPLKSIPDDFFNQDKLVVLEMQQSKLVQVWEGFKSLHNLKTLDLSYSYSLKKSPNFSQVPCLEELILEECKSLFEIHPSIGHLKRLSLVNLRNCCSLISLPRDFYKSESVEILCLNGCSKLRELREDLGEMVSLRILEAENTSIKRLPASIARLKNLTRLSVRFG